MGSSNRQLSEVDAAAADANRDAVRVFRTKGVLWLEGEEHKHYVQGVGSTAADINRGCMFHLTSEALMLCRLLRFSTSNPA